jgi:hypothetical protein
VVSPVSPISVSNEVINNTDIKINAILTDRSEPAPQRRNKNERINSGSGANASQKKNSKYGGVLHKARASDSQKTNTSQIKGQIKSHKASKD